MEGARFLDNLVQKPCTWTKPMSLQSLGFQGFRLCSVRITWTKPAVNRIGKRTGPARILISQILPPWAEKWFPLLSMHAQKITAAAETLIHRAGREPQRQIQRLKRLEIREKISNLGKEFFNIFEDQLLEFGNRLWYHNVKLLDHGVTMSFF